jgi:RNA polymerase sigma factor
MMGITDEQAILASQDERAFEEFLTKNRGFIVKCAYEISKQYINEHDDEWSVSIMAFHEAVRTYDLQKDLFCHMHQLLSKENL